MLLTESNQIVSFVILKDNIKILDIFFGKLQTSVCNFTAMRVSWKFYSLLSHSAEQNKILNICSLKISANFLIINNIFINDF